MAMPADLAAETDTPPSTAETLLATAARGSGRSKASNNAAPSPARSAYRSQFSASSSWILERLRKGEATSGTDSADAPSSLLSAVEGLGKFSTQPAQSMDDTPDVPSPRPRQLLVDASEVAKCPIHFSPPGLKRKRSSVGMDADFIRNTMPFRTPGPASLSQRTTSSVRLKNTPEAGSGHLCSKCGESSLSSGDGALVTCVSCRSLSHLRCAPITTDAADNADYQCAECKTDPVEEMQPGAEDVGADQRQILVNRIRNKRLSKLPADVVPAKPELVGFLARQTSDSERTEYFHGKKRTDLLNILAFCDQLKPQLLVDVLVSVSKRHPDLPMFDDPDWKARLPRSAANAKSSPTSQGTRVSSQPKQGLALLHAKDSRRPRARPRSTKPTVVAEARQMAVQAAAEPGRDGGETSLPPTWPQAGQGLYAKLPPEDEDREFLADDNDEEAFSHFMVDSMGKQMNVSACA